MSDASRSRLLLAVGIAVLLAVVLWFGFGRHSSSSYTTDDGKGFYYDGPVASKSRPGLWVMPDGRIVPPPRGAKSSVPAAAPRNSDVF
jgi:hypothetical protein